MKTKQVLAALVIVAIALGSFIAGRKSISQRTASNKVKNEIAQELMTLTQKDFEEYQSLKSLEDRYQKADEILGKIVTVFLADLGVRMAFKSTSPAMLESRCDSAVLHSANSNSVPLDNSLSKTENLGTANDPKAANASATTDQWKSFEGTLMEARDEHQAFEALKKMEIKDLFASLRSSEALSTKSSSPVLGYFSGEITFFDRSTHKSDWLITWDVRLNDPNKEDAFALITLTRKDDGKMFSRSQTSSGPMQDYMTVSGSKALIVNIRADEAYIQIYPLNGNSQTWVGNVYEKEKRGEYKLVGQVRLAKQ